MTYDQLVAFLAVADAGSFTAASTRLHKSQPAISKLVRNLESELGLELFDRSAYRATLTDAGRLMRERAALVIESTHALQSLGRRLAGVSEPIVRVAIDAVTPLGPVMDLLRSARARHANVRIELATERLAGVIDALDADRADVVVSTDLGLDRRIHEAAPYASVRVVAVARSDHPLATGDAPIPGERLREHAQIILRDSALGDDAPGLNVLRGGLRWTVTDVWSKREIIAAGMGWGGLPEHLVADALARGELVELDVSEFETRAMLLYAVRRRDRAHGVVAQELWDGLTGAEPSIEAPPS
jgi:DNA-binding transcriptional LysR family regulator